MTTETETNSALKDAPLPLERCIKCKHSRHYFDETAKRCVASWADFPSCYCECVFTDRDPDKLIAAAPAMYAALKEVIATHCPDDKFFCGSCSSARDVLALVDGEDQ